MRIAFIMTIMNNSDNLIVQGVPVISTIVELDDHSLAVIDTGMADNPDLVEQLDDMGYQPSDFSMVINTHLHPDHYGGNRHFGNARIIISHREFAYQNLQQSSDPKASSGSYDPHTKGREAAVLRDLKALAARYPVSDFVGNPDQIKFIEDMSRPFMNIDFIAVPGHSIDDRAVVLHGRTQKAIVAGDALYHRDLWHQPALSGINFSEDMFRRSAERIAGFPGIIVPGHDRAFNNANGEYLELNKFYSL